MVLLDRLFIAHLVSTWLAVFFVGTCVFPFLLHRWHELWKPTVHALRDSDFILVDLDHRYVFLKVRGIYSSKRFNVDCSKVGLPKWVLVGLLLFDLDCIINLTVSLNFLTCNRFFYRRDRSSQIWVLCDIQCFIHSIITEIFTFTITLIEAVFIQINRCASSLRSWWFVFKLNFYCFCLWLVLLSGLSLELLVGVHYWDFFILFWLLRHPRLEIVLLVTLPVNFLPCNFQWAIRWTGSILQSNSKDLVFLRINSHILVEWNSSCILVYISSCGLRKIVRKFRNCSLHNFFHYLVLPYCLEKLRNLHSQILDWGRLIHTYPNLFTFVYGWAFWAFCWWGYSWWKHFGLSGWGLWWGSIPLWFWFLNKVPTIASFRWLQIAWHFLLRFFHYCRHQHYSVCSLFSVVVLVLILVFRILRLNWQRWINKLLAHVPKKKLVNVIQIGLLAVVWLQTFWFVAIASSFEVKILQMVSTGVLS